MDDPSVRPIALIGLMGSGKSAVARALGERLGVSVADLDDMIEAEVTCSIAELFEREGEAAFRRREGVALRAVLAAGVRVIACGGGIVLDAAHRALLRERCWVVWLEVSPAEAARRLAGAVHIRPLLAGGVVGARLAALIVERAQLYAEAAHLRIPTDGLTVERVADAVAAALAGRAS